MHGADALVVYRVKKSNSLGSLALGGGW